MNSKKSLLATVGGLALLSGSVQAALIGSFDFATSSGWLADGTATTYNSQTNTSANCNSGALPGVNACGLTFSGAQELGPDGYTTVDWFSNGGAGPSGLDIASISDTLMTNGGWVNTGEITHRNYVLPSPATTLRDLNLLSSFQIVSPFVSAPAFGNFGIQFTETTNTNPCPAPNPLGSVCDDFFEISGLPAPLSFTIDGYTYNIEFRLFGGVGFIVADNTLYTRESATNNLFVQARVTATQVPEPATLGILGLGLLLLNRRKLIK
ncbi:PEP-CTERM sorting domain-containing protein [Rheinheimera sp. D18]|uniref:THxN family PEP-CTERM protein n=1 Tax=Rheinheimera sp. D18 TaxID=2545632 RepID=UPI00104566B2|nr:THxN family PEP-CTERM protein [Rheinheimera sp. D18]QBL09613.1 PEP-CTERM sorting domain-containing protein [Rheinheimera sp. D18]